MEFHLQAPFLPSGDQPQAIDALVSGIQKGHRIQTLQGVTGSGKTFTMANVIAQLNRPTLVLSHNKTLAAQLYSEFKTFFPDNAVAYFISYYDYYQPEAYIPQRDIYIEKDASVNEEIDRLRLAATSYLVTRRDVIIVASVSCIFGLGSADDYKKMLVPLKVGDDIPRNKLLSRFVEIQYERSDSEFVRGKFRVRGDCVDLYPSNEEIAVRIEFWGDEIEQISLINPISAETVKKIGEYVVYPAKHFVLPEERIESAVGKIKAELEDRLKYFKDRGMLLEAQRLQARTKYDLELIQEIGYCPGIENYSLAMSNRKTGDIPETLFEFFPEDYLLFVDESHVTLPQIHAMFNGDHARKRNLVDHGFRLPSALDNRPLRFEEWETKIKQAVFVSATPGDYEKELSEERLVDQVIRPTGLLDPVVEIVPASKQIPHLLGQIKERTAQGDRVLVAAFTKRLAEDIAAYLQKQKVRAKWLHSELDAFERVELLQELRAGAFDVLVGVNLLREGLDLPEVSLVAILDADKEGFLRSDTALIQTIGRSARNVNAKVILYADRITGSMQRAIDETQRRRKKQEEYNTANNITPETIKKNIAKGIEEMRSTDTDAKGDEAGELFVTAELIGELEKEMLEAAEALEFERAAHLRDKIEVMKKNIGKHTANRMFNFKKEKKHKRQR
ncbi:MAG: excinuclease ABC subunit UvrB [Planctomycetaceae bacterium]|jgi:excinuclease ABC subunit B|nr:excinuclease ABC subunit UvrB [Planctomycetaceae bacterium]